MVRADGTWIEVFDKTPDSTVHTLEQDFSLKTWKGVRFEAPNIMLEGSPEEMADKLDAATCPHRALKDEKGYHLYWYPNSSKSSKTRCYIRVYWSNEVLPAENQDTAGQPIVPGLRRGFLEWCRWRDDIQLVRHVHES
jgi:hypothetical protein